MGEHTPLPWRVREINGYRVDQIEGHDRQFVVSFDGEPFEKQQADAAFIVRAVNAHDALVAALRAVIPDGWLDDNTMDHMPGIAQARAALALAEQTP